MSFRPLAGIRGLRTYVFVLPPHTVLSVSVPLRGLEVFGLVKSPPRLAPQTSFRPLAGIRGLRTLCAQREGGACGNVSVPLRGLEVFGPRFGSGIKSAKIQVSVPLRGLEVFGLRSVYQYESQLG